MQITLIETRAPAHCLQIEDLHVVILTIDCLLFEGLLIILTIECMQMLYLCCSV